MSRLIPLKRWEIQHLILLCQVRRKPGHVRELLDEFGPHMSRACRRLSDAIIHPRKAKVPKAYRETAAVFRRRADARTASRQAMQERRRSLDSA